MPRFVGKSSYADAFGAQWLRYADTQLDSATGLPITRTRATRLFGDLWSSLEGQLLLECGAGAGRFTELLLEQGADVTAVDLSAAIDANYTHFSGRAGYRAAQASILDLPFAPRQFDVVVCPGVVQHTPHPEWTIAALYEQVRPGGWLVFDHYRYNASTFTRTHWVFRARLRRLPADEGMRATERLVDRLLPIHKAASRFRPVELVLNRLSPITTHYRGYPDMNDELQREWALLNTHDNLTDYYKHHRTPKQIRTLLELLGAEIHIVRKMPYTVEVVAQRP